MEPLAAPPTVGQSAVIDLPGIVDAIPQKWHNETLCAVNDSLVRLGIFEGAFHWHQHEDEDEFFFVVEGELLLDIEGHGTVTLGPKQGYTVPRGVVHRTRAKARTVVLMVEKDTVRPRGD